MTFVLLSNDDGVLAPGMRALKQAVAPLAEYKVVAPSSNCSGYSNALTLDRPIRLHTLEDGSNSVDGTPADSVHLGINVLSEHEPSMVISGINAGANLGDDVLYSGTVAAATEGRYLGKPAIAISQVNGDVDNFESSMMAIQKLLRHWDDIPLPQHTLLNVNVPDLPWDQIKGFQVTRLGRRGRFDDVQEYMDPRGKKGYWLGVAARGEDNGPGTDFYAIDHGYISITPLQIDMTNHDVIGELSQWTEAVK